MAMLSFHPMCILVGMYIVFMSMVTAVIEAPLIYRISEFTQGLHARFDGVKCWQKGVFYTASIVPVFLCIEFTTILSILFLTGNAVGYIFLAMSTRRQGLSVRSDGGESGLSTTTDDPLLTS
ncbi:hypothetical protein SARC_12834 [Sphaeroforma arctica JP610]|uniref:Uncharacterized protein n=1 Tax=Sphaeroforma arctica JP610 TaxID=667725 RepID=A0A0L0FCY7_9EUKA|nr:hypothetical protein SARC_12834 [Sphaeroforma arctica JP610]KNC74624.1 hypothetical protein SARC_12834 [Sphaeroforma arctica JP610]|eukprot:XP_014148526.1 hypothetical protein SARC_12834 [Sphaeroforma arctica JP610]